jgi:folate-binding protein YgfZ
VSSAPLRESIERARSEGGALALEGWCAFRIEGRDALDLLGRLSTNDLAPVAGGAAVTTIFLTPMGRVLFRVVVQPLPGGELRAVAEPGSAQAFPAWLDRYTFAEDARAVFDGTVAAALVLGPHGTLGTLGTLGPDVAGCGRPPVGVVASGPRDAIARLLRERGALPPAAWPQLRVLAREPAAGAELTEDYHPLEAGLAREISFTKGCYTGQEVVARQDSRGKVSRHLVVLASDAPVEAGAGFEGDMKEGCRVTTAAPERDPSLGHLALAYVGARLAEPGAEVVTVGGARARVVSPPLA